MQALSADSLLRGDSHHPEYPPDTKVDARYWVRVQPPTSPNRACACECLGEIWEWDEDSQEDLDYADNEEDMHDDELPELDSV